MPGYNLLWRRHLESHARTFKGQIAALQLPLVIQACDGRLGRKDAHNRVAPGKLKVSQPNLTKTHDGRVCPVDCGHVGPTALELKRSDSEENPHHATGGAFTRVSAGHTALLPGDESGEVSVDEHYPGGRRAGSAFNDPRRSTSSNLASGSRRSWSARRSSRSIGVTDSGPRERKHVLHALEFTSIAVLCQEAIRVLCRVHDHAPRAAGVSAEWRSAASTPRGLVGRERCPNNLSMSRGVPPRETRALVRG